MILKRLLKVCKIIPCVLLFLTYSCLNDNKCKKFYIPNKELEAYHFMNDSNTRFVYDAMNYSSSDTFFVVESKRSFSNPNCNTFELGENQFESRRLLYWSNSFEPTPFENSSYKFDYIVSRNRKDSLTRMRVKLGEFGLYNLVIDSVSKIKYPNSLHKRFTKKHIDSAFLFTNSDSKKELDNNQGQNDRVSKIYWSDKFGLLGYELNDTLTYVLDTLIR